MTPVEENQELPSSLPPPPPPEVEETYENKEEAAAKKTTWTSKLKNCFLVEPVLIVYFFCEFPVDIICQKYVLDWIRNEFIERDAALNISHDANRTISPCAENISRSEYAFQESIQSAGSLFGLVESFIYGVPAVAVTLLLGAGSDRIGRRFAILPPLLGVLLNSSTVTLIVWYNASIFWFFLGDVLYGMCGSFTAMIMGCYAFVADRTSPEKRMVRITIVEMCMLTAGVVSPIALGTVITRFGYVIPMLVVVVLSAVNLIYVFAFLPGDKLNTLRGETETSPLETSEAEVYPNRKFTGLHRRLSSQLRLLWAQVRLTFAMFTKKTTEVSSTIRPSRYSRRLKLNLLMGAFLVSNLPTFALSISTLFEMNSPLCWGIDEIGLFSGVSIGVAAVGALIITPLLKCFRVSDQSIAILAGLASLATSVYKSFVQSTLMMFLSVSVSMFAILFIPSLRSLMSSQVTEAEQGSIFGAIACVEVICLVFGTVIFNSIYSATLFVSTGFVFLCMALFFAIGVVLVGVYAILIKREELETSRQINQPLLVDDDDSGTAINN